MCSRILPPPREERAGDRRPFSGNARCRPSAKYPLQISLFRRITIATLILIVILKSRASKLTVAVRTFVLLYCCVLCSLCCPGAEICAVCGEVIRDDVIYRMKDEVTEQKTNLCYACSQITDECFVCGLPVKKDFVKLADGRFICARDAKNAVLDRDEAKRLCTEVLDSLDRTFSRFINFPQNVGIEVADRVTLLQFKVPGNDYECPNILGFFTAATNDNRVEYKVRVMSALSPGETRQVAAHEFTHMWVRQNVSAKRRKALSGDSEEGFCELVSYLLMDAMQDSEEKKRILRNAYTRGQIQLFIEANERFGFNDVVDWVKYGVSSKLKAGELEKIRDVKVPVAKASQPIRSASLISPAAELPDRLMLKGLLGPKSRRVALINDRALAAGESGKIRLRGTNVTVECVQILDDSVLVHVAGDKGQQRLFLKDAE